jgi:drug/metabolite transporter (DMT)-like permease
MYNYLQPLVSSLVAVAAGMDAFGWTKGGAALLIFLGVYIVTQSKSRAQLEKEMQHR